MDEETIFARALEIKTDAERRAFLDQACGNDHALRSQVDGLLAAFAGAGSFLDEPVAQLMPTAFSTSDDASNATAPADDDFEYLEPCDAPGRLGKLGPYEIVELIGSGGMGVVFKAFDTRLQRIVAIKVLSPYWAANSMARKRFSREAQAAAAVSHDHVVTIHAVEEAQRPPYLVMEFIAGQSLQQKIDKQGALGLKEILRMGMQMAAALAAAHRQGLVHRDIKPANILLENGVERVKITDFGLARAVDDIGMTQTGMVAGTPQYMAPEQARGGAIDHRADLFSMGAVLYAMCTGRPAFRADSTIAVLRRVCEDTPRPIYDTNAEIPGWLEAIIFKLLSKNPDERYQSAAEVEQLLQTHLAHVQQPDLHPAPVFVAASAAHARRSHSTWWPLAAAAGIVLLCGLAFGEAIGTTKIVATIVRVASGEGTLVIEIDDPQVGVTVDGEELVVTGAGPQEVRVKPGEHKLTTTKDGTPLKQQVVSISRGEREVVKVTREPAAPAQTAKVAPLVDVPVHVAVANADRGDRTPGRPPLAIAPLPAAQVQQIQQDSAAQLHVPLSYTNSLDMRFQFLPPGEFQMGSTADELVKLKEELTQLGAGSFEKFVASSSGPRHRVQISKPFYLGVFEVTSHEYRQFVEASGYVGSAEQAGSTRLDWKKFETEGPLGRQPVCGVSWDDAMAFCKWLSEREKLTYTLPTEAQWEYACRAGSTTLYSFGDDPAELVDNALFDMPSSRAPGAAGSKRANAFGLYDMHGNVDEWCRDWHQRDFYQRSPLVDPECSAEPKDKGSGRVARGGAWPAKAWWARSATRTYDAPSLPVHPKGFRVAIVGDLPQTATAAAPVEEQPKAEADATKADATNADTGVEH